MSRDSNFQIFYKDGYACLTVYPHPDSEKIYPEDVLGRLKMLGVPPVRRQSVVEVLEQQEQIPRPLAKWPEGEKLGPKLSLQVSEDRMSASITIEAGKQGGEPLSAGLIKRFLASENISVGIHHDIIETIVLKQIYGQPVKIAEGIPPINQQPPVPEYNFVTDRGKPFRELEYQRIDLRELNFIQNRKTGDTLAVLKDAVEPREGRDLYGNVLPAARNTAKPIFRAGEGAEITGDGKKITAASDGNARLKSGAVIVEKLISVENVDYSNGNMDFDGTIDVKGRIADGFNVKASGDIQIGKSVSRVNVISGGDIILKAGISGNDEGRIICGGDLYARYIESARIFCRGNIFVEEAIMHSDILAGGNIVLGGKRAEIFGGRIFSGGSISCKKLGSINEPVTDLFLGSDLDTFSSVEKHQSAIRDLYRHIDDIEMKISQIESVIKQKEHQDAPAEKLEAAQRQFRAELEKANAMLANEQRDLIEVKKASTANEDAVLSVEQQIYGKVHVFFNQLRWDSPGKGTGKTRLQVRQGKLLEK